MAGLDLRLKKQMKQEIIFQEKKAHHNDSMNEKHAGI